MEIWKDIDNFKGLYQVSNFGRVKSLSRFVKYSKQNYHSKSFIKKIEGKILKPAMRSGYHKVVLCKSSGRSKKHKQFSIHRLVAAAFLHNERQLPVVNHKDGIKTNNHYTNLEWVTVSENNLHSIKIGLTNSKHCQKKVRHINTGLEFDSLAKAAIYFKTTVSLISAHCRGIRKKPKYKFI